MCAAMYLKGIFEFSKKCNLGSLKEFHIIDINDEVLDMVKDWYTKYLLNPACIEIETVLSKIPDTGGYSDDKRYGQAGYGPSHGKHDGKYDRNGREVAANAAAHGSTKIIRNFCEKTDIHIYTEDILRLINVDVIVVSEDGFIKGEGGLSKALLNAGCSKYRRNHKELQPKYKENRQTTVLLTPGGDKLPFTHVLHAVLRRQIGEQEDRFQSSLKTTINNVLIEANNLDYKKRKGISLAIPMIGLGKFY